MRNFNSPYLSKTVGEFWTRWHISLSTWFRDYLYIPLGGNRVTAFRWYRNILVVFLLSGLWHGANWTYIIWGAMHGTYLIVSSFAYRGALEFRRQIGIEQLPWIEKLLAVLTTFSLVTVAWIFFRANSVADASYILTHLLSGRESARILDLGLNRFDLIVGICAIGVMETIHLLQRRNSIRQLLSKFSTPVRWATYYAAVFTVILFGKFNSQPFIYFQF